MEQHPDWYLYDKQGKIIRDYNTPALDSTHPEVLEFLRKLFTTSDDWGFEYYKFDGEHALPRYIPSVDRSRLHDPTIDPMVAYRKRLQVIRSAIGPGTFVEGCPAGTPLNGIGYLQLLLQRRRRLQQLARDVRRSSARSTPTRSGTTWLPT